MSLIFALALVAHLALKLWLSARQMRHVARRADAVPPAFADAIPLDDHRRAARYTIAKQRLVVAESVIGAVTFAVLTWGGVLDRIERALVDALGDSLAADVAFVGIALALLALLDLPLEWYRRFGIEQRFGFNRMTPAMFVVDAVKTASLAVAIGGPLVLAMLALMRYAGPAWWCIAWLVWSGFSIALTLLYPRLIAPLFNRFTPLSDAALRERIGNLLQRTGFRSDGVFTMDGSRRSAHGNAYFTGLGSSKRIVFFDTLLAQLHPDEIEAVLAHELGHFRLHHVRKRMLLGLALSFAWLALLGWLRTQDGFLTSLGMDPGVAPSLGAPALVLFMLVAPLLTIVFAPLQSAWSRGHEFEADAFAAEHADASSLVRALVKLYRDNAATLTPDPVHSAFYDSHPPAAIRIDRLRSQRCAAVAA